MDEASQQRVVAALNLQGDAQFAAIRRLTSAVEIHHFALNYNVNDSALPLLELVRNPKCDAGTALYLYWQCWPGFESSPARLDVKAQFDFDSFREEIALKLDGCGFASSLIHFDPAASFSKTQLRRLQAEGFRYLDGVDHERIERIWL